MDATDGKSETIYLTYGGNMFRLYRLSFYRVQIVREDDRRIEVLATPGDVDFIIRNEKLPPNFSNYAKRFFEAEDMNERSPT